MRGIVLGSLSLLTLLFVAPANAGPEEEALEAMAACRAIASDPVRLACMDAASQLLDDISRTDTSAGTLTSPTPSPAPSPVAPAAPAIDRAAADAAAERAALIAEREALAAEREALATERAAIEAAAASPPTSGDPQPSLLERLRPASRESTPIQIVKIIRRRRTGNLRFVTDEGLIFDQASTTINFHPPSSLPAEATIDFGALGSKWIRFTEEPDRKYKVSFQD